MVTLTQEELGASWVVLRYSESDLADMMEIKCSYLILKRIVCLWTMKISIYEPTRGTRGSIVANCWRRPGKLCIPVQTIRPHQHSWLQHEGITSVDAMASVSVRGDSVSLVVNPTVIQIDGGLYSVLDQATIDF
jgi:hypothetical protein